MYRSDFAGAAPPLPHAAQVAQPSRFQTPTARYAAWRSDRVTTRSADEILSRILDVVIVIAVLIFTGPLLIVLALVVKLSDGGPAVFSHPRVGRNGKTFKCLKFRSMVLNAEAQLQHLLATDASARLEWQTDQKLRRDPRITPLGQFLRKSSLDELPQLFNVLAGDMSIVGPRPIVQSEIVRYGRGYRYYCMVRPGITGLWQVSGRNNTTYFRRVALDRLYARSKCVTLNAKIIVKTIPAVLLRDGSY